MSQQIFWVLGRPYICPFLDLLPQRVSVSHLLNLNEHSVRHNLLPAAGPTGVTNTIASVRQHQELRWQSHSLWTSRSLFICTQGCIFKRRKNSVAPFMMTLITEMPVTLHKRLICCFHWAKKNMVLTNALLCTPPDTQCSHSLKLTSPLLLCDSTVWEQPSKFGLLSYRSDIAHTPLLCQKSGTQLLSLMLKNTVYLSWSGSKERDLNELCCPSRIPQWHALLPPSPRGLFSSLFSWRLFSNEPSWILASS